MRQITVPGTGDSVQCKTGGDDAVIAMKALILYVVFVTIGGFISAGIGYYVEKEFSSTASLIVFLALFFSNFALVENDRPDGGGTLNSASKKFEYPVGPERSGR
jgi:hypothetical protein